jgi:hypothetical protein
MAGKAFTSATLSFKGSTAKLKSMGFNVDANAVDITTIGDAQHVFETGIPTEEITMTVGGQYGGAVKASGPLVVNFTGSDSTSIATALLVSRELSGELDGEVTTALTFRRSN